MYQIERFLLVFVFILHEDKVLQSNSHSNVCDKPRLLKIVCSVAVWPFYTQRSLLKAASRMYVTKTAVVLSAHFYLVRKDNKKKKELHQLNNPHNAIYAKKNERCSQYLVISLNDIFSCCCTQARNISPIKRSVLR